MAKKKWDKPTLTVLLLSKTDQLVLTSCFRSTGNMSEAQGMGNSCASSMAAVRGPCTACSDGAFSGPS